MEGQLQEGRFIYKNVKYKLTFEYIVLACGGQVFLSGRLVVSDCCYDYEKVIITKKYLFVQLFSIPFCLV